MAFLTRNYRLQLVQSLTVRSIQNASSGLYVINHARFSCRCSSVAAIFPTSTGISSTVRCISSTLGTVGVQSAGFWHRVASMWQCPRCFHTQSEEVATTRTQVAEVACEGCGCIFERASPGASWVLNEGDYIGSATR